MTVSVNNQAWGRVAQLVSSFSYSASKPPDNVYSAISATASGTVTLYKAIPNQGYQFVRWENITARAITSWITHYPASGSTPAYDKSGESDEIRKAKNTTTNPIGYDSRDASLWNGNMYAPPTWGSFGHLDGYDNASNIGLSCSCDTQDQNIKDGEPYLTGSSNVTWIPQTITAVFAPSGTQKYTVTTISSPQQAGDTIGGGTYAAGETCTITATANDGWEFSHWSNGSITINTPTHSFSVSSNSTWTAYFVHKVSVMARVRGESVGGLMTYHGSVSINSGTPERPSVSGYFYNGDSITLTAIPDNGYRFIEWVRLSPSTSSSYNVNPKSVTLGDYDELWEAVFEYVPPSDAYVTASVAQGQEDFGDVRINSGAWLDIAKATFSSSQTVTAEARSTNPFYVFKNWTDYFTGSVLSTNTSYSFQVYTNPGSTISIVANFEYSGVRVRLEVDGGVGGTVRFGSLNLTSRDMYVGESDTIIATPSQGWEFVKWKRESSDYSTDATTSISVSSASQAYVTYTAIFKRVAYKLTLFSNPQNLGLVAYDYPDPDTGNIVFSGFDRTVVGMIPVEVAENVDPNKQVEILPSPLADFVNWEQQVNPPNGNFVDIGGSPQAPYLIIQFWSDVVLRANFQNAPTYTVTATVSPSDAGSVSGVSNPYHLGDPCSVTATPASGYYFVRWEDDSGNPLSYVTSYSFNVQGDTAIVAVFEPIPVIYTVTTTPSPEYGGTTTGDGDYQEGSPCTVTATPADGFEFSGWYIDGSPASTLPTYSFDVYSNIDLVAQFSEIPPEPPIPRDPTHLLVNSLPFSSPVLIVHDPITGKLVGDYYARDIREP